MSQETSGTYESDALLKRQAFIDLVTLKRISETSFESSPGGESPGANMYGGTLMSQALMAAGQTSPLQQAHSLHAQLLRPADVLKPTLYEVFTLRESRRLPPVESPLARKTGLFWKLSRASSRPARGSPIRRFRPRRRRHRRSSMSSGRFRSCRAV